MSVVAVTHKKTATYPADEVEARLKDLLLELVASNAALHGVVLPPDIPAQCAAASQIDSLDVVDVLCGLDSIVGFELKDSLVQAGGYPSINAALSHLLPRIESAWKKKHK